MKNVCELLLSKKFTVLGKYFFLIIVCSLVVFSCTKEDLSKVSNDESEEEQEIVFSLNVPSIKDATPQLRSIGATEENTVKTIDLLAFRKDNTNFNYYYAGMLTSDNTPGATTQNCRVKVRMASYEQDLVIITNAGTLVSDMVKSKDWTSTSKEVFLANLEVSLSQAGTKWKAISVANYDALPMWGETSTTVTKNTNQLSVSLLRMLAKIDVQLDDANLAALKSIFKIKSVRLYNTNTRGRIVPNSANIQQTGNGVIVTAPSLPSNPGKYLGPLVYTDFSTPGIPDVAMKGAIYTFETQAPDDSNPLSPLDATCLVVGGIYGNDAAETFYRVDFLQNGNFQNILRNNRYLVNIVSVTGSGYSTDDEAFHNKAVNMTVNILNWDISNMYNVTFDGQWYLSVSKDSVIFSREAAQTDSTLFAITDYNPPQSSITGWQVESIIDNATHAPCTWLTVAPMQGAANELKNVKITTTAENTTGSLRSATITFVAGRLRYPIKVCQSLVEKASVTITCDADPFGVYKTGEIIGDKLVYPITLKTMDPPIVIRVTWTPKNENLTVYKTTIPSIPYGIFNMAPDITGIQAGSIQPLVTAIAPNAIVSAADLDSSGKYLHEEKFVFSVSNGLNVFEKDLILIHVYNGN